MGRIALGQRKLLAQPVKPYAPCKHVLSPGDFYETVEPPANGGRERQVSSEAEWNHMSRDDVLPDERRNDNSRFARLCGDDCGKQGQLVSLVGASSFDH